MTSRPAQFSVATPSLWYIELPLNCSLEFYTPKLQKTLHFQRLCEQLTPERVVFLTDVSGVYDRPPGENGEHYSLSIYTIPITNFNFYILFPGAILLKEIRVSDQGMTDAVTTGSAGEVSGHDVTGGMALKLDCAVNIVRASHGETAVYVCDISDTDAETACVSGTVTNATLVTYTPT